MKSFNAIFDCVFIIIILSLFHVEIRRIIPNHMFKVECLHSCTCRNHDKSIRDCPSQLLYVIDNSLHLLYIAGKINASIFFFYCLPGVKPFFRMKSSKNFLNSLFVHCVFSGDISKRTVPYIHAILHPDRTLFFFSIFYLSVVSKKR